jgi:hypothetical protein
VVGSKGGNGLASSKSAAAAALSRPVSRTVLNEQRPPLGRTTASRLHRSRASGTGSWPVSLRGCDGILRWPGAMRRRSQARLAERAGLSRSAVSGSSWTRSKRGTTPSSPSSGRSRAAAAASSPRRRAAAKAFVFALPGGQAVVADRRRSNATCARRRGRTARLNGLCKATRRSSTPSGRSRTRWTPGFPWCREWEMICGNYLPANLG